MPTSVTAGAPTSGGAQTYTWTGLSSDVGVPVQPNSLDGLAAFVQTSGDGSVEIEYSADNINWVRAADSLGSTISLSGSAYAELSTAAVYIRPVETGGGTATVVLATRGE